MKKPVSKIVQEPNKEDAGMELAIVRMDLLVIIIYYKISILKINTKYF
jgi:hypothetical protein